MRAIAIGLLIAGCAAFEVTEAECRHTNWFERGKRDALDGHPMQLARLSGQCARKGIDIPQRDYLEGYRIGYDEWYRTTGSMRGR